MEESRKQLLRAVYEEIRWQLVLRETAEFAKALFPLLGGKSDGAGLVRTDS